MSAISGQKVVTTAGTAVALGALLVNEEIIIKALDTNTGVVAVGNDGANDVTLANGFRLSAKDTVTVKVGNLSEIYVDSAVNGEGVCWLVLEV